MVATKQNLLMCLLRVTKSFVTETSENKTEKNSVSIFPWGNFLRGASIHAVFTSYNTILKRLNNSYNTYVNNQVVVFSL